MFNIGGAEFLVILLVALLVLGPNKLPQAARQVGHFLGEFRRVADGFQQELKSAMDVEAPAKPTKPTTKPKSPGGPTDQGAVIDTEGSETGEPAADDASAGTADPSDAAGSADPPAD